MENSLQNLAPAVLCNLLSYLDAKSVSNLKAAGSKELNRKLDLQMVQTHCPSRNANESFKFLEFHAKKDPLLKLPFYFFVNNLINKANSDIQYIFVDRIIHPLQKVAKRFFAPWVAVVLVLIIYVTLHVALNILLIPIYLIRKIAAKRMEKQIDVVKYQQQFERFAKKQMEAMLGQKETCVFLLNAVKENKEFVIRSSVYPTRYSNSVQSFIIAIDCAGSPHAFHALYIKECLNRTFRLLIAHCKKHTILIEKLDENRFKTLILGAVKNPKLHNRIYRGI